MKKIEKSIELGGRSLTLTTGTLAGQADGAVLARYGDTVVLATVVSSEPKQELDYFPLSVDYQERLYAGGRIKGSRWVKREGRPTDEEILKARLIDRSIRPLFPKGYKNEVQVIVMVLSVDLENDPGDIAPVAVSAAIHSSRIPWDGPVGVVKVGVRDGSFFTNPLDSELPHSEMELVVSSTKKAIVMIEAGAKEVPEDTILGGIEYGQKEGQKLIKFIDEFAKAVGNKKESFEHSEHSEALVKKVEKAVKKSLPKMIDELATKESGEKEELKALLEKAVDEDELSEAFKIVDELMKKEIRKMILGGKRPDGRKHTEIRKLTSEVSVLPRTHGSAVFTRGETQVMSVATLGSPSMGQLIETAEGEEEKRYIHHYSMPPYASGETGRVGSPNRREIGHGALAERALIPVLPSEKEFPYAIRIVSEVMSSNGSTSMASTCGSTLSLMDAGVPISRPVSGIAMGLVIENEKSYAVLSDIAGIEDFNGDMDFKVTGTENGVTALQLDVKTLNLTPAILKKAIAQAKEGREFILASMLKTIKEPRAKVSNYAPKIRSLKIDTEKIGEVIGPGGKNIKKIISETGAQVDVEEDGTVNISGLTDEEVKKAYDWVEGMTKEVQPGEIYKGTVKRVEGFGAFVEILPGKEGLVHVSDMSEGFVKDPGEVVKLGDTVEVRVKEIDNLGRLNLSMILDPAKEKKENGGGRGGRGGMRRESRDRDSRGRGNFRSRGNREGRSSGPHFPASRLVAVGQKKRFER